MDSHGEPVGAGAGATRRGIAAGLAAICLMVVAPLGVAFAGALAQAEGDWTGLQGGAGHPGAATASVRPPLRAVWRAAPSGDARLSSPAVASDLAVSTSKTGVIGFDPASGEVLWDDVDRAEGLVIAPAIDPGIGQDGLVVFVEGNGPEDSRLVGLDPVTRRRTCELPLGDQSRTAPNVAGGLGFVGTRDRAVLAVDLESGAEVWRARTEADVTTSPAVTDGSVFVLSEDDQTGRSRLYAFDAADGRQEWTFSPSGVSLGVSSATVSEGSVYVGFGDFNVRALDAESGALRWIQPVRGPFSPLSTLAVADGSVYALDRGGGVYRFDAESGALQWDYQFPSLVTWGSPLVVDGTVYVGMDDGTIAAIDAGSGHLVWSTRLIQGGIGSFAPHQGSLLAPVIGGRGGVVAFQQATDRALVDIPSPSELDPRRALLNFLAGSAITLVLILAFFRFVLPRVQRR